MFQSARNLDALSARVKHFRSCAFVSWRKAELLFFAGSGIITFQAIEGIRLGKCNAAFNAACSTWLKNHIGR